MTSEFVCYKENDHWRLKIPFPYPLRMQARHFKTQDDAKAAILGLMEDRQKLQEEADRRNASIVEISDSDFSQLFNAALPLFPKNEALQQFMLSLHADRRVLVIRKYK